MTVLILLWIALGRERLSHGWEGWILAAPIALLALAFGLHSNPVLLVINFLIIPPLFIVHAMMVGRFNPVVWWRATFINEFLEMIFYRVFSHFDKPIRLISGLLNQQPKKDPVRRFVV